MSFHVLRPDDPLWGSIVASTESDIYHLPGYAVATEAGAARDIRAALVSVRDRHLLVPLVIREVGFGSGDVRDATSPYGYPGPVLSAMNDDERNSFLQDALPELVNGLSNAGILSAFVRMHPLVGLRPDEVGSCGTTVHHGDTVSIDLTFSEEELWSQTRRGHRYEINRSHKRGHTAFHDAEWHHFDAFLDIYAETMGRVEATGSYFFSRDYFVALRQALGEHLHLWVVDIEGEVAAASLFTEYNGIVQYHLSGTRTEHLKAQPNKLLLHEVRSWAKARGNSVMHLGGGVGGQQDSLFAFKAGFSKQLQPFHSWRLITNHEAYEDLVRERGFNPEALDPSGFFPAYRRPRE
jgi:hypothetical protein